MKFKVGDRVRVVTRQWSMHTPYEGAVVSIDETDDTVEVCFPGWESGHWGSSEDDNAPMDRWYFCINNGDELEVIREAPSIAKDLKLTPQAKTVLRHLNAGKAISPMNALMVYGISRLASCIHEIRKAGYVVTMIQKRDEQGHKYARYSFPKEEVKAA